MRGTLLAGVLLPVVVVISVNAFSLYHEALLAVNAAYDRTLLASAKAIGEHLTVEGFDEKAVLRSAVPYSALEAFEADVRTHMFYRVSNSAGRVVAGFEELPAWTGKLPDSGAYGALVDFYDSSFRGNDVRVAVLLQPVAGELGRAMAVVQVAETLEMRRAITRTILAGMLRRQALELVVIAFFVVVAIQMATKPVRKLSAELLQRPEGDLTPIETTTSPPELKPLLFATNDVMSRLEHLLEDQKRFVRDAAHQLRTPLAILNTQLQSAIRHDVDAQQAFREIKRTVDRATRLTNQMLSLAKVEQLKMEDNQDAGDFCEAAREASEELTPLIVEKDIEFEFDGWPAQVRGNSWLLRELVQNLLHNALTHTPTGGAIVIRVRAEEEHACVVVADSGPGIALELHKRLFQPFSAGDVRHGTGLGLAICQEIARNLGGTIKLENRTLPGRATGLQAIVRIPLAGAAGNLQQF